MHRSQTSVPEGAEGLEDGAVEDVRPDRVRRLEAEDDHENGRHQAATAHSGEPDEGADEEPGESELPGQGF